MMYRALYELMKETFGTVYSSNEMMDPFLLKTSIEQRDEVLKLMLANKGTPGLQGLTPKHAAAFVLLMQLKVHPEMAGTEAHFKLRDELEIPPVTAWAKEKPPRVVFDLTNTNREPSWFEEYQKMGEGTHLLSFKGAHDRKNLIHAAKTALGIGGMEDDGDPRALDATDKTLGLLVSSLEYFLSLARPEWFSDNELLKELPTGVDGRPNFIILREQEVEKEKIRAEQKRAIEVKRRAEMIEKHNLEKQSIFPFLETTNYKPLVDVLADSDFAVSREIVEGAIKKKETWLTNELLESINATIDKKSYATDELLGARLEELARLAEQFILGKVQEVRPAWFTTVLNGDIKFRKAPHKEKGLTREEMASRGNLARLCKKYGMLEISKAVKAVFGLEQSVAQIFGKLPEGPVTGLAEESEEEAE